MMVTQIDTEFYTPECLAQQLGDCIEFDAATKRAHFDSADSALIFYRAYGRQGWDSTATPPPPLTEEQRAEMRRRADEILSAAASYSARRRANGTYASGSHESRYKSAGLA